MWAEITQEILRRPRDLNWDARDRWSLNRGKKVGTVQPELKHGGSRGMGILRETERICCPGGGRTGEMAQG